MDRKYNWYEVGIININPKKFMLINDAKKGKESEYMITLFFSLCVLGN